MVHLISLKMQGVRSVGEHAHCIEFLRPLTLIQGPNGTGKTTVIECLNYVISGNLPSGQLSTFLHDPRVSNKAKMDSLVQLKFANVHGVETTGTKRSTNSVVARSGKLTGKSDESTIHHMVEGQTKSVSSKVVDYKAQMIEEMGVSKAILDYVIFCHQEHSCWPLDAPKALKEKFDEIFDVSEFVEVINRIKRQRLGYEKKQKNIDNELDTYLEPNVEEHITRKRELKQLESELKQKKDEGKSMNQAVANNTELIAEMDKEISKLEEEMKNAKQEMEVELRNQLDAADTEVEGVGKEIAQIEATQFSYKAEIERLRKEIRGLEKELAEISNLTSESEELAKQIDRLELELSNEKPLSELELSLSSKKAELLSCQNFERILKAAVDIETRFQEKQEEFNNRKEKASKSLMRVLPSVPEKDFERKINEHIKLTLNPEETAAKLRLKDVNNEFSDISNKLSELKLQNNDYERRLKDSRRKVEATGFPAGECKARLEQVQIDLKEYREQLGSKQGSAGLLMKWEKEVASKKACPLCERPCGSDIEVQQLVRKVKKRYSDLPQDVDELESSVSAFEKQERTLVNVIPYIEQIEECTAKLKRVKESLEPLNATFEEKETECEKATLTARETAEKLAEAKTLLGDAKFLDLLGAELRRQKESAELARSELPDLDAPDWTLEELRDNHSKSQANAVRLEKEFGDLERCIGKVRKYSMDLSRLKEKMHRIGQTALQPQMKRDAIAEKNSRIREINAELSQSGAPLPDLREKQKQSKKEVARITNGLTNINGHVQESDVGKQLNKLRKDRSALVLKNQEMREKRERAKGSFAPLVQRYDDLKQKLGASRYSEAALLYQQKYAQRKLIEETIKDLDVYLKALDVAILNYHSLKMERINSRLSDLWAAVYNGNDIETIRIKSDSVKSTTTRKSYDYHVMMVIDGKEYEMRDRCSAGQKMLASILIRIALADVFASNCPILALDEPTTNLDVEKIDNIANMLERLISSHRGLQIVVITHDEQLVRLLYRACRPEYIYALSKDEYGVSKLKQHSNIGDADED